MREVIRWGILGTGNIANKFAEDLRLTPDASLAAVGSRTAEGAERFGKAFNVPHRHSSYEALANNEEVDCVYIATPHPAHRDNALLCLKSGKPVLCEKPFTINAIEAVKVVQLARKKKLLLMEAMWTRCFPVMRKLRELLASEVLGEVKLLTADFGCRAEFDPKSRLFSRKLGGGALLDLGVYPVSLASMIFSQPKTAAEHPVPFSFTAPVEISGTAVLGKTKVDEQAAMTLRYADGELAVLHTTVRANTLGEAMIYGTRGHIKVHAPFWKADKLTLSIEGRKDEVIAMPYTGHGYHFEATEFMNCLRENKQESALIPLDETISIMRTLDTLRAHFGVRYPSE